MTKTTAFFVVCFLNYLFYYHRQTILFTIAFYQHILITYSRMYGCHDYYYCAGQDVKVYVILSVVRIIKPHRMRH